MKNIFKIVIGLWILLIFWTINGYSQSYRLKSIDLKKNIVKGYKSDNIKQGLHKQFHIPYDYDFLPTKQGENIYKDNLGLAHERFFQFYKGIKIEDSDIRIHYRNDTVESINGEYANEKEIDIIPILDKNIAINKAIKYTNAKKYIWEIPNLSLNSNDSDTSKKTNYYPNTELVICKNRFNTNDSTYHLAYKVDIFSIEPLNKSNIYVDAKDGTILNARTLSRSSVNGQANTAYSGFQTISTYYRNGTNPDYILKDDVRNILTKNLIGYLYDPSRAIEFTDIDNNWAYDSGIATAAHWGLMMAYDYFLEKHLRNSYNNLGGSVTNYVPS